MNDNQAGWTVEHPTTICAICGHIRNLHETIDRQRCAECAGVGKSGLEAWHLFTPAFQSSIGQS